MKKKILLISAVALALIIVLGILAIFSRRDPDTIPTDATTPNGDESSSNEPGDESSSLYVPDNLPENLNFGNVEVTFLTWNEVSMNEFYVEQISGDIIGDAIYERNLVVEERLGVKLNYIGTSGDSNNMQDYIKKAEIDIQSGSFEYDIYAAYSRTPPAMALKNMLADLTTLDYIDFDMPWWPDTLINQCLINNKLYYCSGDISTNLLWMMVATFFNKNLIADEGLENPYTLVQSHKWTIDKFIEMTTNKYRDLNGNAVADDSDYYGFSIYSLNFDAFFNASGFIAFSKNSKNEVVISPDLYDQKIFDLIDKLGAYVNSSNDVRAVNSTKIRTIFFEERSIFTTDRVFIVAGKDNGPTDKIEFDYGIIPNPMYNEQQENYSTNVGHPFTMYAISTSAFDQDICAAVLECLGSESYRKVTPMVFETAMKHKYASDATTTEMYDILRSTVCFDLARFYDSQANSIYSAMRTEVINNTRTFASRFKNMSKVMEKGVASINQVYFG